MSRRKFTDEQEQEICTEYEDGCTTTGLGERWGCNQSTVVDILKRRGVTARPAGQSRRLYTVDHHYFDVVDTADKAYWLGFLGADGCVYNRSSDYLGITLATADADHIHRFLRSLQSNYPVKVSEVTTRTGSQCSQSYVRIASTPLVSALSKYGVVARKTFTFPWPHQLPDELLPHFLRGYFDGDGCISASRHGTPAFTLTGNMGFLVDAQQYLMTMCELRATKIRPAGNVGAFSYGGRKQLARIGTLLYRNADCYLPRKRDRFVPHIETMAA